MAKDLEQLTAAGLPARTIPIESIKRIGRQCRTVQNQGDIFQPDKIAPGNLPQDQINLTAQPATPPEPEQPAETIDSLTGEPCAYTDCQTCGERMKYLIWKDKAHTVRNPVPKAHHGRCLDALKDKRIIKRAAKEARKRGKR